MQLCALHTHVPPAHGSGQEALILQRKRVIQPAHPMVSPGEGLAVSVGQSTKHRASGAGEARRAEHAYPVSSAQP